MTAALSIWASHLIWWGVGGSFLAAGILLNRVKHDARDCKHWFDEHRVCIECGLEQCEWCEDEGYPSHPGTGHSLGWCPECPEPCSNCDGTGAVASRG